MGTDPALVCIPNYPAEGTGLHIVSVVRDNYCNKFEGVLAAVEGDRLAPCHLYYNCHGIVVAGKGFPEAEAVVLVAAAGDKVGNQGVGY